MHNVGLNYAATEATAKDGDKPHPGSESNQTGSHIDKTQRL
jgi:hypothetical protein